MSPAKRQPAKRPSKPSGNRTTTGTVLGSLITINFGGGGRSKRRGGGLTGLLAALLKAFNQAGGGRGGGKPERPGRGDVDDHLDSTLDQAPGTNSGPVTGPGTAGHGTPGPRRAR